ncbi:MAG: hypothetical protein O3C43_16415 [Verrucomicrobia bacterium]|nr:hypothetical protein [Verrucomicrobiota bacterium]
MNKFLFLISPLLVLLPQIPAAVLTVDNNAGSVAMFTGVQAAINAANTGDTILIAGSPNFYGDLHV